MQQLNRLTGTMSSLSMFCRFLSWIANFQCATSTKQIEQLQGTTFWYDRRGVCEYLGTVAALFVKPGLETELHVLCVSVFVRTLPNQMCCCLGEESQLHVHTSLFEGSRRKYDCWSCYAAVAYVGAIFLF